MSRKLISNLHASVDELAASNPEALAHLAGLLETLLGTDTAIPLPSAKRGGRKSAPVLDDEEEEKPARRRGKAAAPVLDDEDEDDADDEDDGEDGEDEEGEDGEEGGDAEELDDLEAESIKAFFQNSEAEEHERISGGLKEMEAEFTSMTSETVKLVSFYKRAKAATPKDKRTAMVSFLAKVHATIDAIMEFELDSVVDAISEISGEDFTPKGRGQAAKELAAATELFRVAFATDD